MSTATALDAPPEPRRTGRSVAVVGGGFGGVGAAVMLRRAGYDDVTVFERGERIGGVWHHNTYPGAACDVPSHLYEFSFAPNPRWSRRYAPQAEIQAYLEDVARGHGVLDRIRTEHRGDARALGRGARAAGCSRRAPGRTRPTSWSPPAVSSRCPSVPPIPGLDDFAGPGVPHRALAPRRRPRRQARRRHRHRLQRDPGRPGDPAGRRAASTSTSARRAGRSRRWTSPTASARKRLFERFPVAAAARPRGDLRLHGARRGGHDAAPLAAAAVPRASPGARSPRRSRIPSCARKVTPADEIGCKRIMLTDDWYPTLTQAERRRS